jgi:hypothetical protein
MVVASPSHTEYVAEQITKIAIYLVLAAIGLYFTFRTRKPPK